MTSPSRSAVILCGGRSVRMGRDKASLPFGSGTLLTHIVGLVTPEVEDVVVVARRDQDVPHDVHVVRDPVDDLGPLSGIAAGLRASRGELVFVAACDMPLLRPAVVSRLFDLIGDQDACVPVDGDHVMTLCAVYRRSVLPYAEALVAAGQLSVRALVERLDAKRVDAAVLRDIDPGLDSFFSCDTPEAYETARTRSAARRGPGA